MPFPPVSNPNVRSFNSQVTFAEVLSCPDIGSLLREKLEEGHNSMVLPPLPPGWYYEVTVDKLDDFKNDQFVFRTTYTPRKADEQEEENLGRSIGPSTGGSTEGVSDPTA